MRIAQLIRRSLEALKEVGSEGPNECIEGIRIGDFLALSQHAISSYFLPTILLCHFNFSKSWEDYIVTQHKWVLLRKITPVPANQNDYFGKSKRIAKCGPIKKC